jgi:hypothetical protein
LLANEPAYARLRRSSLDYIAIESPADVLAAVRQLRSSPTQYAAMVANGRRRSVDYSIEATKAHWMQFLLDDVVPDAIGWQTARRRAVDARLTQLRRVIRQKLEAKRFKLQVLLELQGSALPWTTISAGRYDRERARQERPAVDAMELAGPRSWIRQGRRT